MAKGKGRDAGREARWRRVVQGQRRSGLTIREFCRKSNLPETAFYFWRRELARREGEQEQSHEKPRRAKVAAFLPVRLAVSDAERVTDEAPTRAAAPIEIVLSGGRRVHVTAPVDRQALADVLAVLEGQPC